MSRFSSIALLALAAWAAYLLYRQTFHGDFMYDDAVSLAGLEDVVDIQSALLYVMGGHTGPLGRPLSLASFLINASAWPADAGAFLFVNTLLHLANGVLVAWLAYIVAKSMPERLPMPGWFATLVAAAWLLHPAWTFLVLHAVQRMAILATTFVLLGLIAYLHARTLLATRPHRAMALMAGSLVVGTLLAMLAKENGALLPLFAATLEWLLRQTESDGEIGRGLDPTLRRIWKYWGVALFWAPALALAAYLLPHWPGFNAAANLREFTGGQRLLTEARVLWQYLFNLFLPRPLNFTPFFDDYVVSKDLLTPIATLFAVLAWALVVGVAWYWRRRFPMLTFAVAWYFVGHGIESTILQLEIYFEHRNYLPSLGFLMLAVYGLWQLPDKLKQVRWLVAGVYLLLFAFVLGQVASLWSNPARASEVWVARHPLSVRTVQFHANSLGQAGRVREAVDVVWQAHLRQLNDTGLAVQGAELICWVSSPEDYDRLVDSILPGLRVGNYSHQPSTSLPTMFKQLNDRTCPAMRASHLHKIIDALMANPKYQVSAHAMAVFHFIKGRLYMRERDFNATLTHMLESSRHEQSLELTLEISRLFASGGLYDEALKTLAAAMRSAPTNPILRQYWQERLEAQRLSLLQARAASETPPERK